MQAAVEPTAAVYPVVAHYYTLQGEGAFTGHAAYFIRLAGCDVGCPWCDTKESWTVEGHPLRTVDELAETALSCGARRIVVTGGEPTMHDLLPLTQGLDTFKLHIETSGAYPLTGDFDWVTLSPKKYKAPVSSVYTYVDELKVVVAHRSDFQWGEKHRALCKRGVKAYFQPEWDSPHLIPDIVSYVKENPFWSLSVQAHKYLKIP